MKLLSVFTVLSFNILLAAYSSSLFAAVGDFTAEKRYNLGGQVTGIVQPDPDGAGPLGFPAVRNTYNTKGLLVRQDDGQLTARQPLTIEPENWSGFTVNRTVHYTHDIWGRVLTERISDPSTDYSLTQYSYDTLGRVLCKTTRMNPDAYNTLPDNACELGIEGDFGPDRVTRYTYDSYDNIKLEERAVGTDASKPARAGDPAVFELHGRPYHAVGTLRPSSNKHPHYGQLYTYDAVEAA